MSKIANLHGRSLSANEIWTMLTRYSSVVRFEYESIFFLLIENNFFPKTDYSEKLFLCAITLIDSEFYNYKCKIFEHFSLSEKLTLKYLVRYFKYKLTELDFEPDDSLGSRKQRLEHGWTNQRGAFMTYSWLQQFCK